MLSDEYGIDDVTAQEISLHMAMCVNLEYIQSWGLEEFMSRLSDYLPKEKQLDLIKMMCQVSPESTEEANNG